MKPSRPSLVGPRSTALARWISIATISASLLIGAIGCADQPTAPSPDQLGARSDRAAPDTGSSELQAASGNRVPPAELALPSQQWCMLLDNYDSCYDIAAQYGLHIVKIFYRADLCLMQGDADPAVLANDPRIKAIQENTQTVLSNPVELTMGFHQGGWDEGAAPRQSALAPLMLNEVQQKVRGRNVRVAVLDTGVDPTHSHLQGRVELPPAQGYSLPAIETANGIDDDEDGLIDEAYGHGTHVAGIIATVAPAATIIPLRVLNDDGIGDAYTLAVGLYLAKERGAQIVNLSLVLSGEATVIHDALRTLKDAGIVIVGAAGNQPGDPMYPASDSHVVSVAATGPGDIVAPFSASNGVRLAAPGVEVESSYPGERTAFATGTSMACAVASGCLALLSETTSVAGDPRPLKALEILRNTAVSVMPTGMINDGRVAPERALRIWARRGPSPNQPMQEDAR